jgi:2-O-methyltransferase
MKLLEKSKDVIRTLLGIDPPVTRGALDIKTLPRLLGTTDPVILEVGCNDGTETLRFLETFGPDARIYAFEPEPRAIKRFQQNVTDPRARLFECALSDVDGTTDFYASNGVPDSNKLKDYRPEGWDLSGSIMKPKEHLDRHPWCKFEETITIRTKTLDSWCVDQQVDAIDFIWVDVQGAEERFIRGAQQSLRSTRYLYTEYSNRELYEGQVNLRRLLELLPEFEVVTRYPGDVLLKNRELI